MKYANAASCFGFMGVILFIATTIIAAMLVPGYSHVSQLISESYAIDTTYGMQLRFFGFLPAGICMAVFAFLAMRVLPKHILSRAGFYGIGIFYGLGTVAVSFFPCDAGCNKEFIDPSFSQFIHNLTGTLTYLVVPVPLIFVAIAARKWTNAKPVVYSGFISGIVAMVFIGILSAGMDAEYAGLYQRIIEGSILAFIVTCSMYLLRLRNKVPQ
ncbi:MAG: DUF998 domain-containing protein [Chitinophagaceae bacterium]|nr:DUF998 domain-containing protein [Chitinophagaceae bacterium]